MTYVLYCMGPILAPVHSLTLHLDRFQEIMSFFTLQTFCTFGLNICLTRDSFLFISFFHSWKCRSLWFVFVWSSSWANTLKYSLLWLHGNVYNLWFDTQTLQWSGWGVSGSLCMSAHVSALLMALVLKQQGTYCTKGCQTDDSFSGWLADPISEHWFFFFLLIFDEFILCRCSSVLK